MNDYSRPDFKPGEVTFLRGLALTVAWVVGGFVAIVAYAMLMLWLFS